MTGNLSTDNLNKLNRDLNGKGGKNVFWEYVEALLTAVLLAFLIRSFVIEPYKIPSKSMVPTLLVGDHIFVNKYVYGLRIPATKKWIAKFDDPKRGEVIVFIYPENPKLDFIKRVVGVPGDKIRIDNSRLFVNDQEVTAADIQISGVDPADKRRLLVTPTESNPIPEDFKDVPYSQGFENYKISLEDLGGTKHYIQHSLIMPNIETYETTVPEGNYFVLGDNRDQSADSRYWGFVPRENLKGRAIFIWLSLDSDLGGVRIHRFGREII